MVEKLIAHIARRSEGQSHPHGTGDLQWRGAGLRATVTSHGGLLIYELIAGIGFIPCLMVDRAFQRRGYGGTTMIEAIRRLRGLVAEAYLAAASPLAAAMAALMRPRSGDRVELRLAILERLVDAELDEARQFLLVSLVETYLELDDMERAAYEARVTEEGRQAGATIEMTWADRIRQEGLATGLAQGREEGAPRAKRAMLLELIHTRFGVAPDELALRIEQTDNAGLTRLFRQVMVAEGVEARDI